MSTKKTICKDNYVNSLIVPWTRQFIGMGSRYDIMSVKKKHNGNQIEWSRF